MPQNRFRRDPLIMTSIPFNYIKDYDLLFINNFTDSLI